MIFTAANRSFFSILLIVSMLFSISGIPAQAAVTSADMQKYIKWGTIGGVAISAVIGAATFGIGGFLIGGAIGAVTTSLICDHFGVTPQQQWKTVFPNFKMPFKYDRQRQSGSNGSNIPAASGLSVPQANSQDISFAEKIRETYQKAYKNYTEAVQNSKDSGLIKKAREAYQKAKAELDKLK